ncbi:poly(A) RNA polymerase, mitochondrial isoform X1 [Syngnathoides biaculeatus]|uniref:poly(A) RNA polymerase, mitochondrial isoform X1 n=1 Tax=Syngnathoides biaculeatus TaxID=300417 RepID=UPI002ADDAB2B|nr:poly(A) RNA polymerase, mitochondrial isoform X1 [Syngnathoides biaculeatus]
MASTIAAHRLHMSGRTNLAKCLQKVDRFCHRRVGTTAVSVRADVPRKDENSEKDGRLTFYDVQAHRQEQAERSVLINCHPKNIEKKILSFLSLHGEIKKYFTYESYGTYAVVEFDSQDSVSSLLEETSVPSNNYESMVPYKSRLLTLGGLTEATNQQSSKQNHPQTTIPINELIQRLSKEESIDQQIVSLTKAYQLTEENSRLRFLVCSLLKDIAAAYFPECAIKPFGSSVNGFGKLGCDLDMFLDLDDISGRNLKTSKTGLTLEYQMRRATSERAVTQSILSVIGECVDQFGPGCVGVQKILNARCPLVRFAHQPSGFQCDLTANNRVAMKSSELLYLYAQLDPRVRHLVFTVRCWARAHGVTSTIPGAWITNFSLTVMVLFFLQRRSPSIIPTLDHLRDLAGPADKSVIEGNDCTFVSDFDRIQFPRNTETLEKLLCEFFEFYATFAFSKKSINIRKGKEQNKPETSPLHIQNPFETTLNVSKNVNGTQLERFVALCQESAWLLQQSDTVAPKAGSTPTAWGLATLLLPSQVAGVKSRKKRKREPASERIKSLLESLKNKNQSKS